MIGKDVVSSEWIPGIRSITIHFEVTDARQITVVTSGRRTGPWDERVCFAGFANTAIQH